MIRLILLASIIQKIVLAIAHGPCKITRLALLLAELMPIHSTSILASTSVPEVPALDLKAESTLSQKVCMSNIITR
jgi:hypothetical protein